MAVRGVAHGAATTTGTIRPILTSAFHLKPRALWQTQIERTHHTHTLSIWFSQFAFFYALAHNSAFCCIQFGMGHFKFGRGDNLKSIECTYEWMRIGVRERARARAHDHWTRKKWVVQQHVIFFFSREMLRNYISFVPYISDNCSYFIGSYGGLINQCNQIFNRLKCIMLFNK